MSGRDISSTDSRPNFLLIFADQWRGDCLGAAGHPVVETPNLDQLAAEGTLFDAAYAACPSCIAARATLATGQTPSTCGRIGYRDGVPWRYPTTLMRVLRDAGYQTMQVGKTHFYPQRAALGFEEMRTYDPQRLDPGYDSDYHVWLARTAGPSIQDTAMVMDNNSWIAVPWPNPVHLHPNVWTTDAALELLDRRDPTRPFFLQIGYHRPHAPLDPPLHVLAMYERKELPPVPCGRWAERYDAPVSSIKAFHGRLPKEILDRARRAYYAQITHLDDQIGRILFYLRRRNMLQSTWVFFSADHGELLGDHWQFRKVAPWEGSAKIPWIIRPPAGPAFRAAPRCSAPVSHYDIMPSILDAAGVSVPPSVEGRSILPLLRDPKAAWREYVHGEHSSCYEDVGWQFVTDGREKFAWDTKSGREWFFDLVSDPQELHDRSGDPSYAERVEIWRRRLVETLAARPRDGLSDGKRLIPGKLLPTVRPELLVPRRDTDGIVRPVS